MSLLQISINVQCRKEYKVHIYIVGSIYGNNYPMPYKIATKGFSTVSISVYISKNLGNLTLESGYFQNGVLDGHR